MKKSKKNFVSKIALASLLVTNTALSAELMKNEDKSLKEMSGNQSKEKHFEKQTKTLMEKLKEKGVVNETVVEKATECSKLCLK